MSMDGNGLSVADALALGRDNDGMFGDGNGSWIFFLFFLLAWGGNFGNWGGNGMNSTASAYTDGKLPVKSAGTERYSDFDIKTYTNSGISDMQSI